MENILSAKYLVGEGTGINRAVHLFLEGEAQMTVPIRNDCEVYAEILKQVAAGTLTIQDAD